MTKHANHEHEHHEHHEHVAPELHSDPGPPGLGAARGDARATSVVGESTIDWTNYATGEVHAAGDHVVFTDLDLAETLFGIGFIRRVPPADAEPKHDDATRRRHR